MKHLLLLFPYAVDTKSNVVMVCDNWDMMKVYLVELVLNEHLPEVLLTLIYHKMNREETQTLEI